jgi:hypothetical protein
MTRRGGSGPGTLERLPAGSARSWPQPGKLEALRAVRRRLAAGQLELDPGTLRRVDVLARRVSHGLFT